MMDIPFSIEEFLNIFQYYNESVWPAQIILYVLALISIFHVLRKSKYSDKYVSMILSVYWIWMGIVYHLMHFAKINNAAYLFGTLFIMQGIIFFFFGIAKSRITYSYVNRFHGILGVVLIIYALIIYPWLGYFLGHVYPRTPTFGVPCPTTIFTFGILLWTDQKLPKPILIIPFLWSIIGFSAAVNLGIQEDFGLVFAGLAAVAVIIIRDRNYTIDSIKEKNT